jgi:hypothetical protein
MAKAKKTKQKNTFAASVVRVTLVVDIPVNEPYDYRRTVQLVNDYDAETIVAEHAVSKITHKLVETQVEIPEDLV